jgi:hypothetical protein
METQNKYVLFGWNNYYPNGGWDDLIGVYDSVDEAKAAFEKAATEKSWKYEDAGQIVLIPECRVVFECEVDDGEKFGTKLFKWKAI